MSNDRTVEVTEATNGPRESAGGAKKQKRNQVFVSWAIQGRMLVRLVGFWALYHFVLAGSMFLYHYARYFGEQLAGGEPRTFLDLFAEFTQTNYSLVVCALAVLPLFLWDAVKTTHRVAGPLVRFQNSLRALARGERVEPIKLRKGDMPIELQDAFNEYLASLEVADDWERSDDAENSESTPTIDAGEVDRQLAELDREVQAVLAEH